MCPSLSVAASGSALFKALPLKTANGICIEFCEALILLTEGLFVCLLSAFAGSNRNHTADFISAVVLSRSGREDGWKAARGLSVCPSNCQSICSPARPSSLPAVCVCVCRCVFVSLLSPLSLTRTLCRPVRLGDSQTSWVSDTVSMQGFSPIRTV